MLQANQNGTIYGEQKPMPYFGMTLPEFQRAFPDDRSCYEFLFHEFWPEGFCCPSCSGPKSWFLPSRSVFECGTCGRQISLTAGSIFHRSKVPLRMWFWTIFMIATSKKGCSAMNVQRRLGIGSYKTAWLMSHKIRRAMSQGDQQHTPDSATANNHQNGGERLGSSPGQPRVRKPVLTTSENQNGVHLFERLLLTCLTANPLPEPALSR